MALTYLTYSILDACAGWLLWGHFDPFPTPRLNGRCRFGQATFIGTHGNERDAPIADLADKTPHFFKASDRRRETPVLSGGGVFLSPLGWRNALQRRLDRRCEARRQSRASLRCSHAGG